MTLRFRKRIKVGPGIWLNLSRRGISTSIGVRGLTVNLKGGKTRTTASLPGTGLSYSTTSTTTTSKPTDATAIKHPLVWIVLATLLIVYFLSR